MLIKYKRKINLIKYDFDFLRNYAMSNFLYWRDATVVKLVLVTPSILTT